MVLAAAALAFWQPWVFVYAATAILALVGPWRLLEEAMLERRFGEDALRYRRAVPAFLATVWLRHPPRTARSSPPPGAFIAPHQDRPGTRVGRFGRAAIETVETDRFG
jgi:hypothetical protein